MKFEKHTGVYDSEGDFLLDLQGGVLVAPWVACIAHTTPESAIPAYEVRYSSTKMIGADEAGAIDKRLSSLEMEKVYLTEAEYETIIKNKDDGQEYPATAPDGTVRKIKYSDSYLFFIYEPEAPRK